MKLNQLMMMNNKKGGILMWIIIILIIIGALYFFMSSNDKSLEESQDQISPIDEIPDTEFDEIETTDEILNEIDESLQFIE